jgi:hypothetical protein
VVSFRFRRNGAVADLGGKRFALREGPVQPTEATPCRSLPVDCRRIEHNVPFMVDMIFVDIDQVISILILFVMDSSRSDRGTARLR